MLWVLFSILSPLSTAISTVLTKIGLEHLDPIAITALQTLISSIVLMAAAIYSKSNLLAFKINSSGSALIVILALFIPILSDLFYVYALKHGPLIPVSTLYLLYVPLTLVICVFALNEPLSTKSVIGAALVLLGTLVITL